MLRMPKDKVTSKRVGKVAGRLLGSQGAPRDTKTVAASDLSQVPPVSRASTLAEVQKRRRSPRK